MRPRAGLAVAGRARRRRGHGRFARPAVTAAGRSGPAYEGEALVSANPQPRPAFGARPITATGSERAVPTEEVAPVESGNAPKPSKSKGGRKSGGKTPSKGGKTPSKGGEPKHEAKKASTAKDDKPADVVVRLKKSQRKRLKEQAAIHGMTPAEAVTQLVRLWLD